MNFTQQSRGAILVAKSQHAMASPTEKKPENIAGLFYVDSTCIDCDLCRETAGAFFRRDSDSGQSVVYRQPESPEEIALAEAALDSCPTNSIGDDGA
jgi:ferredoxin